MLIASTFLFGYAAANSYGIGQDFNESTRRIREALSAFPARQTAFKIGNLCVQAGCFCLVFNCLAMAGGSIYVMATRRMILFPSSVTKSILQGLLSSPFMKTVYLTSAITLGVFLLSIPFFLYARPWQLDSVYFA